MKESGNRALILEVALELFAARGYDAVGVQEIVEAAGVTKPTLYHYFGSKRGLLEALVREHAGAFLGELRGAAAYGRNLPATLDRVAAVYLGFAATRPVFCRFLLSLLFVPAENEAHAAAARDHGNMRGRQRRYAYSLLGVLNGYALLVLQGQVRPDDRLRREIVHQFNHGIYS